MDPFHMRAKECGSLPDCHTLMYTTPILHTFVHFEYQLIKVYLFFYRGQVVPFSECGPTRRPSLSKTIMIDAYFRVYIKQNGKTAAFCDRCPT